MAAGYGGSWRRLHPRDGRRAADPVADLVRLPQAHLRRGPTAGWRRGFRRMSISASRCSSSRRCTPGSISAGTSTRSAYVLMCVVIVQRHVRHLRLCPLSAADDREPRQPDHAADAGPDRRPRRRVALAARCRSTTRPRRLVERGGRDARRSAARCGGSFRAAIPAAPTAAAIAGMERAGRDRAAGECERRGARCACCSRKRRRCSRASAATSGYKAFMDMWLYFHVPLTFALLAALLAHVISVFFLCWPDRDGAWRLRSPY